MNKLFSLKAWIDEVLSGDERYNILEGDGSPFKSNVRIELATPVAQAADPISAEELNRLETAINDIDNRLVDTLSLYTTGGSSTAYTIATTRGEDLSVGESFRVEFHTTAGSNPTLNRDSKGAKSIKYYDATGTKQAATSEQIIANMILTILYDGTDYVILGGGSSSGGGGLTTVLASITTSNLTATKSQRDSLDISGMTANRNWILPGGGAVGDEVEVALRVGNDTYALIIIGDTGVTITARGVTTAVTTEWSRLFTTGESLKFVKTSTTNWQLVTDGRIPCIAVFERNGSNGNTTHAASTDVKADWNSLPVNRGNLGDLTNDRAKARRAGYYECSGGYAPAAAISDQKFANAKVIKNGATKISNSALRQSTASSSSITGVDIPVKTTLLAVGDYLEYFFNTEEIDRGLLQTDYSGAGNAQISQSTFFQVREVL